MPQLKLPSSKLSLIFSVKDIKGERKKKNRFLFFLTFRVLLYFYFENDKNFPVIICKYNVKKTLEKHSFLYYLKERAFL